MASTKVCEATPELLALAKKFRFRKDKNIGAISMKADVNTLLIGVDETYEDVSIEDIADDLPTAEPRYLLISYVLNHSDGRISYPLCFVYYSPPTARTELRMLYTGSKKEIEQKTFATKSFDVRNTEELTDEWLQEELSRI